VGLHDLAALGAVQQRLGEFLLIALGHDLELNRLVENQPSVFAQEVHGAAAFGVE
jgi:hypothetical protein